MPIVFFNSDLPNVYFFFIVFFVMCLVAINLPPSGL